MLSDLIYVDTVNTNLICCICRMPFMSPTATTTCTHTFCKDCITKALAFNEECPVDRIPLTLAELHPASTIVRNLVDELIVQCPNQAYGCKYTCQRQLLGSHLTNECLHVSAQCCEKGCNEILLRRDADRHSHTCIHRLIVCEGCSTSIKFKDAEYHTTQCPAAEWKCSHCENVFARSESKMHLTVCLEVQISCTHSVNGCPWTGCRKDGSSHLSTCPYESIKGFFAINTSRLTTLEAANASLSAQVDCLEASLAIVQREAKHARTSLGPWFRRPSDPQISASPARHERIQRRRLSIPLAAASFPRDADTDADETETVISFGNEYFSSFQSPSAIHMHTTSTTSPMTASSSSEYVSTPYFPIINENTQQTSAMPSYAQSRVAPVDLSTSLEGCFNSLRNSMVTLSASLDSLERRQDLALTTETLRMHEDVASLRAIVHGLRMQVHSIMMDRNWQASGRSGALAGVGLLNGAEFGPQTPGIDVGDFSGSSSRPYSGHTARRSMENKL